MAPCGLSLGSIASKLLGKTVISKCVLARSPTLLRSCVRSLASDSQTSSGFSSSAFMTASYHVTKPGAHMVSKNGRLFARCMTQLQKVASSRQLQVLEQPWFEPHAHQISRISSMASPEITGKDGSPGSSADHVATSSGEEEVEPVSTSQIPEEKETHSEENSAERTSEVEVESSSEGAEESDSEDFSKEELLGLLRERQEVLESKEKIINEMKDRILRSLAEVENVRERARREAESTKKYAVQNFAKDLLDVADNLGRAAATVPENIRNGLLASDVTDTSKLLKSLLEGVEMTEKQLVQVFKKHGVEKFDPVGHHFDPNQHLALFEVQDSSKDPGIIATVVKCGYKLYDRVIRPAEVGVVKAEGGEIENAESS